MATFAMCFTVLALLAREHPNGLTKAELLERADKADHSRFGNCMGMIDMVLGFKEDGTRADWGLAVCWKEENGKIFYDTTRKSYAPNMEIICFADFFNEWLKKNDLAHLVLFEKQTPENSERCPLGFDWEVIPGAGHCNWDYEQEGCGPDCGCKLSKAQLKAAVIRVEHRDFKTYYMRPLDGD